MNRSSLNRVVSNSAWLDELKNCGIQWLEQLAGIDELDEILNWAAMFDTSSGELKKLQQAIIKVKNSSSFLSASRYQTSYIKSDFHLEGEFATPQIPTHLLNAPVAFNLLDKRLPTRDQGSLGSCAAFATIRAFEVLVESTKYFSPAHCYLLAKQLDGDNRSGTTLSQTLTVLNKHGSCLESMCPYDQLQHLPLDKFTLNPIAVAYAKKNILEEWMVFSPNNNFESLIQLLKFVISGGLSASPRPIVLGTMVRPTIAHSPFAQETGEWHLDLPWQNTTKNKYGHAMVIPPFLTVVKSRGYAAINGGFPPLALCGRS